MSACSSLMWARWCRPSAGSLAPAGPVWCVCGRCPPNVVERLAPRPIRLVSGLMSPLDARASRNTRRSARHRGKTPTRRGIVLFRTQRRAGGFWRRRPPGALRMSCFAARPRAGAYELDRSSSRASREPSTCALSLALSALLSTLLSTRERRYPRRSMRGSRLPRRRATTRWRAPVFAESQEGIQKSLQPSV